MQRGGARPRGTDGSDFAFRMRVDERYKKAAKGRVQVRKIITMQAALLIIKGVLALTCSQDRSFATLFALASGMVAVLVGTIALKQTGTKLLQLYMGLTMLSLALSSVPAITGNYLTKVSSEWQLYKQQNNYVSLASVSLDAVVLVSGTLTHLVALWVAASFLNVVQKRKN